jgi:hypothetical protein
MMTPAEKGNEGMSDFRTPRDRLKVPGYFLSINAPGIV